MTEPFRLAHLSDPHLGPLPRPRLRDLANKRMLGWTHWRGRRRARHRPEILADLLLHLKSQAPDHVALTGDLVNIALASEINGALTWLGEFGPASWVSVVPGNHDAYVAGALPRALGAWSDYVAGDDASAGTGTVFPYIRRRGPLGIVGLSSAVASGPFSATGRVGKRQIAGLREALERLGREGCFRVVLIHHPPVHGAAKWQKRLVDTAEVVQVLSEAGAELVLHGHTHRSTIHWLEGSRPIPVVGIAAASAGDPGKEPASYNLFAISGAPPHWHIALETWGIPGPNAPVSRLRHIHDLVPGATPPSPLEGAIRHDAEPQRSVAEGREPQ